MVHACCCRGCTCTPPRVSLLILCGTFRLHIEDQYGSWAQHNHPNRDHGIGVHLYDDCTCDLSAIAISEFILWPYLVSDPEIAWAEIQGSGFQWGVEIFELKHGSGTDATRDGRDRDTEKSRRTGSSMACRQHDRRWGDG